MAYVVRPSGGPRKARRSALQEIIRKMTPPLAPRSPATSSTRRSARPEDPRLFFLYEQYVDEAGYEAHHGLRALHAARQGGGDPRAPRGPRARVLRDHRRPGGRPRVSARPRRIRRHEAPQRVHRPRRSTTPSTCCWTSSVSPVPARRGARRPRRRRFNGSMKIKLGPVTSRYQGTVTIEEADEDAHRAVLRAQATDATGQGTAAATITTVLQSVQDGTRVAVETDLRVSGPAAQFGRGVMQDVSGKLMRQFADCLAEEIEADGGTVAACCARRYGSTGSTRAAATRAATSWLPTLRLPGAPPWDACPSAPQRMPRSPPRQSRSGAEAAPGEARPAVGRRPRPRRRRRAARVLQAARPRRSARPLAAAVAIVVWRRRRMSTHREPGTTASDGRPGGASSTSRCPSTPDMITFPRVPPPALLRQRDPRASSPSGSAPRSTASTGCTAHYLVVQDDHVGTHCDARKHIVPTPAGRRRSRSSTASPTACCSTSPAPRRATSSPPPRSRPSSTRSATRSRSATSCSSTPARAPTTTRSATDRPPGDERGGDALADRARRADDGLDAITFDPPVWAMFEKKQFWEAHRVMWDEEYWHLENLMNLEQIGRPHGFQLVRAAGQVDRHDGGAGARGRDRRGLSRVLSFDDARCAEVGLAGGKGASLARMTALGLPVPPGFVVPADALGRALAAAARDERLRERAGGTGRELAARRGGPALVAPRRSPTARPARSPRPTRALGDGTCRSRCARAPCRGLRGGELRRPAGDLPARARRRRTSSSASATAGPRSSPSGRCSTAARRARSPTSAWPSSSSAWSSPTSPASCSRSTRPGAAATRWSSRPCSGSARRVVSGQLTPDHYVLARDGRVKRAQRHDPAVRDRPRPRRRDPRGAARARARARRRRSRDDQLARAGQGRRRPRGAPRRPAGHRVGDRRTTSSSSCSRGPVTT